MSQRGRELTPLEEASLQNQKLKAAYEARMARLDPSQAMQKTSLTLSLQRQMMENLVIARAREETHSETSQRSVHVCRGHRIRNQKERALTRLPQLQRKMEERRLRLQEAANRRFCSQVALTPEEREQRALYAAILEYEQDHDWPKHWRAKLKKSPGDLSLVTNLVSHLLSIPDHPISQLLRKLQCAVYRALYPIVSRGKDSSFEDLEQFLATSERWGRGPGGQPEPQTPGVRKEPLPEQLKCVVKDIHDAIDRLLALTLLAFEGLNTAASKDRCLACIEEPFFSPLWPLLLAVYRSLHRLREAALGRSMELYRNAPPAAIGVPTKLLPRDPGAAGAGAYPYCAAAQELGLLVLESCPQKKLECIVRALRVICACAEGYYRDQEAEPQPGTAAMDIRGARERTCRCVVPGEEGAGPPRSPWDGEQLPSPNSGADDLLPILSFVALRSGLPQLVSECAALEEFIHEGYLIGEEGYCLTSLQSALSYVELLPRGALGGPAKVCPGAPAAGAEALLGLLAPSDNCPQGSRWPLCS
ncbi:VPS9 domain-containing protein 1 [Camelus dromedarius]|uniref:VPS9 domain-containing protein 1 n=1 Tax=Camelus dromedarius TaxID=9838 RepID=A0A5N4CPV6_CAMDR|nr:VPS9 domain-containing protein 1 [Camelus dromedarius]